ncbi:hypothetical protein IFM89_004828 [Coptis chinensis]|uniref:Protein kinase domain-containing protein n=1 Tax=Coptis chinensis TaxID=261450 RepID=A0A835H237_9MAGN|nr:hypothetical protein IFM89_004828 [Coptis chinensis]
MLVAPLLNGDRRKFHPRQIETALAADEQFEACLPSSCGKGPNISYPFWINGNQSSFCGFPGFELSCKDREPILTMEGDEYIIRKIFYGNQSFLMTKAGVSNDICSSLTYSLSLSLSVFTVVPATHNLLLFFNCTALQSREYLRYELDCTTTANPRHRLLAMLSNDPMLTYVNQSGQCDNSAVIPVDTIRNGSLGTTVYRDFIDEFLNKGFHLRWTASRCEDCSESGGRCGFDYVLHKFMCFCPDRPHQRRCSSASPFTPDCSDCHDKGGRCLSSPDGTFLCDKTKGVTGIGGVLLTCVIFILYKRHKRNKLARSSALISRDISRDLSSKSDLECRMVLRTKAMNLILPWKKKNAATKHIEAFFKNHGSLAPKQYCYNEVKIMTRSFKNKLGQGGYGSVFKGKLKDGRLVAVKVLCETKGNGEEFINEVASISRTSHVNIVNLLGYCFEGSKRALVYEYMSNGSLEKHIYVEKPPEPYSHLGWETLHQIAVGIARGLEYLHRGCNTRILHFDIKPHNILLDEEFRPKISDFGLAKLCPRKESIISMLGGRGTIGYIAPEVVSRNFGGISHKSDVYSYGMMILEMVGARKNIDVAVDHTSEIYFPSWIYKRIELDEDLGLHGVLFQAEKQITRKMILVGLWCIQTNPSDRPSMSRVLEMLEGSIEVLSIPPKPFLSSPPRGQEDTSIN